MSLRAPTTSLGILGSVGCPITIDTAITNAVLYMICPPTVKVENGNPQQPPFSRVKEPESISRPHQFTKINRLNAAGPRDCSPGFAEPWYCRPGWFGSM